MDRPEPTAGMMKAVSTRLTHLERWNVGEQLKHQYSKLNPTESYYEWLTRTLAKSLVFVPPFIVLGVVTGNQLWYFIAVGSVAVLLGCYLATIRQKYKKQQNGVIQDLPNLISKMMIALETGTSFERVFEQVAEQSQPLMEKMLKRLLANLKHQTLRQALHQFATEVDVPIMYDFISVIYVGVEKGYKEAMDSFAMIKNDLKILRQTALAEKTKGNPQKMNLAYGLLCVHIVIFLLCMAMKIIGAMSAL